MKKILYLIAFLGFMMMIPSVAQTKVTGLSNVKLYLDPGHSQKENMGIYNYSEAEKVLQVALTIKEYLLAYTDMQDENIRLCRTDDTQNVSLDARSDEANAWNADFFYSIHSDASGMGSSANSTLFLYGGRRTTPGGTPLEKLPEGGKEYGDLLNPNLTGVMRVSTRGNINDLIFYNYSESTPYLSVNRRTTMASHLSEAGFHTNAVQNMQFMNADHKRMQAYAAFQSLVKFLSGKYGEDEVEAPQVGIATGFIKDALTSTPINGATITLTTEGEEPRTYITDTYETLFSKYHPTGPTGLPSGYAFYRDMLNNGFYWIEGLTPGATYNVKVEATGFETQDDLEITIPTEIGETTKDGLGILDVNLKNEMPSIVKGTDIINVDAVPLNRPVSITFSRKMNRTSVAESLSLSPEAEYVLSWANDYTLRIGVSELEFVTEYELRIDGKVAKDSEINIFLDGEEEGVEGTDYVLNFTTEASTVPYVVSYDPQGDQTVSLRPVVRIEFDQSLVEENITANQLVVKDKDGVLVSGTQSYHSINGKSAFHYIFNVDLNPNESYTVTLNAKGLESKYGLAVAKDFVFTFIPRKREQVITKLQQFETNAALTASAWANGGQITGLNTNLSSITYDENITPTLDVSGSVKMTYTWQDVANAASEWRLHNNNTTAANRPALLGIETPIVQFYLYGDGSGTRFGLVLQRLNATGGGGTGTFYSKPVVVDWVGWKLISWDIREMSGITYPWVGGSGPITLDEKLFVQSLHVRASDPYNPFITSGAFWLSSINAVQYGDFEGAFEVKFDSQDGSAVASNYVTAGETTTSPDFPSRDGYSFDGWYKEKYCVNAWNFATDKVTANTTLYAKWSPIIVSYDPQSEQELSLRPIVRIEFREPLDAASIAEDQLRVMDLDGTYYDGVQQYVTVNGKSVLHYIFNADLEPNTIYKVILEGGYKTAKGATMADGFEFTFTPRKNLVSVNEPELPHFNKDKAPWNNWLAPTLSGQTAGVVTSATNFAFDPNVLALEGTENSFRINYQWDVNYAGSAIQQIRQHFSAMDDKDNSLFERENILQYYLFGDGSHTQVALALRATGGYWTHRLIKLDWVGWKLVSWDLANDYNEAWAGVAGSGPMPDENVKIAGVKVAPALPENRSNTPSSVWLSGLRLVTLGELEGAFTVTFDSQDGSDVPRKFVTDGDLLMPPIDPIQRGFVFAGWFKDPACTDEWDFEYDTVDADVTLYAGWDALASYTVTFDSNGGSEIDSEDYFDGEFIIRPDDPLFEGNMFDGWYTDEDVLWNFFEDAVTEDLTLTAKWKAFFIVTFESNGGSLVEEMKIFEGERAVRPADPVRDGFAFEGWFKDAGFTAAWNFINDVVTEEITLYAKWRKYFTVTFDPKNGDATFEAKVLDGDIITKPEDPVFVGNKFNGWTSEWAFEGGEAWINTTAGLNARLLENMPSGTAATQIPAGTPLLVVNKRSDFGNTYTYGNAMYNGLSLWFVVLNNGWASWGDQFMITKDEVTLYASSAETSEELATIPDGTILRIGDRSQPGFDWGATTYQGLSGWVKLDLCDPEVELVELPWDFANYTVTEDVTLFGSWTEADSHTVTFDSQGGSEIAPVEVEHNDKITKPVDPTREGYNFDKWVTKEIWEVVSDPFVNFRSEPSSAGGEETIIGTIPFGTLLFVTDKDGTWGETTYEGLTGWFSLNAVNSRQVSKAGDWNFATDRVTGDITLYAEWTIKTYTVTFDSQEGSLITPETVEHGDKVTKPADPTLEYYIFGGWFKEAACTNAWDFDTDVVTDETTLFAKWTGVEYTVAFDSRGGSDLADAPASHGGKITKPEDPEREGYTFEGWFKEAACTNGWDFANDVVTGSITLYAKWTIKSFTITVSASPSSSGVALGGGTFEFGTSVSVVASPNAGFKFDNWTKGGTVVSSNQAYTFTASETATLVANFSVSTTGYELPDALLTKIYPNPTDGIFTLEFELVATYIITITDMTGKVLQRQTTNDQFVTMDISSYSTGAYLVVISDGKNQSVTRIVKN